jgi:NAD(P)H-nitrite reductase large subunit
MDDKMVKKLLDAMAELLQIWVAEFRGVNEDNLMEAGEILTGFNLDSVASGESQRYGLIGSRELGIYMMATWSDLKDRTYDEFVADANSVKDWDK